MLVLLESSVLGKGRRFNTARTGIYHYIRNLACAMRAQTNVRIIPICLDPECAVATLEECKSIGLNTSFLEHQASIEFRLYFALEKFLSYLHMTVDPKPCFLSRMSKFVAYLKYGLRNRYLIIFERNMAKCLHGLDCDKNAIIVHETFRTHQGPAPEMLYKQISARCVTIYDMIPLLFPHLFNPGISEEFNRFISSLGSNDTIVAISATTKSDLCTLSKIDNSNVFVTPLAVDSRFRMLDKTEYNSSANNLITKYALSDSKFILSIATLEPRKNISCLISAFAATVDKLEPGIKLVLTGEPGWEKVDLRKLVESHGISSRVVFTGYLDDEILPILLSEASLFCYLSLYEGFGMPVLEAMSCGCPVITSNTSSLGEFFSDVACCVDPTDISEISRNMHRILSDQAYSSQLRSSGLSYARKFSSTNLANRTLDAYKHSLDTVGRMLI